MKKLTLSIGLVAAMLSTKAQDTTCTYFKGKEVYEFNYQTDKIISKTIQKTKYYDIKVKYGDVLCLDLSDEKSRIRKVITTFFDGDTVVDILDSKDILELNFKLMQLEDVDISGRSKESINNICSQDIPKLVKPNFMKMLLEDSINMNIKNPELWLKDTFSVLNTFALKGDNNWK